MKDWSSRQRHHDGLCYFLAFLLLPSIRWKIGLLERWGRDLIMEKRRMPGWVMAWNSESIISPWDSESSRLRQAGSLPLHDEINWLNYDQYGGNLRSLVWREANGGLDGCYGGEMKTRIVDKFSYLRRFGLRRFDLVRKLQLGRYGFLAMQGNRMFAGVGNEHGASHTNTTFLRFPNFDGGDSVLLPHFCQNSLEKMGQLAKKNGTHWCGRRNRMWGISSGVGITMPWRFIKVKTFYHASGRLFYN